MISVPNNDIYKFFFHTNLRKWLNITYERFILPVDEYPWAWPWKLLFIFVNDQNCYTKIEIEYYLYGFEAKNYFKEIYWDKKTGKPLK